MRLLLLLAACFSTAQAQTVAKGRVTDAATGEGLAAATVQVEGTSRGTITNREGDYEIVVPEGAGAVLVVRFIGYTPASRAVPASGRLDVALAPAVAELGEAVVTAGNPADNIMRRVIARKARWQAGLGTWRAEAYSRQTIRSNDEVVAVIEGQTTAFWDRDRGLREVVTGSRRTGNMASLPPEVFTAADQILNFYDDEIEFGGYRLMGPTHPRALSFYTFAVVGTRALGDRLVYDLSFRPSNGLQPGLTGTLAVLADADALISISARPSDAVQFPLVRAFDLTMAQQFSSFNQSVGGQAVWLPADFRMDASAKPGNALIRFPKIGIEINSRLTDYAVNVAVPDSLYETTRAAVDSVALAGGLAEAGVVPLSAEEERALAEIDSTRSLVEALRPSGPFARFVSISTTGDAPSRQTPAGLRLSYDPILVYNRAEGARVGLGADAQLGRVGLGVDGAYLTAAERVSAHAALTGRLAPGAEVGVGVRRETIPIGGSGFVTPLLNSVPALVAGDDYFDYARREGVRAWAQWWRGGSLRPSVYLGASLDDYDPALVRTRYTLTERPLPPDNVVADARDLAAGTVRLSLGDLGDGLSSGVTGHKGAAVRAEIGRLLDPQARLGGLDLASETYRRVEGEVRWFMPTILRRRLLAPTLHVRLAAGTASGGLPVQRAFGIDGQHAGLSVFGGLRARTGRLTLVRRYALVAWEHDFRSVPFEALGWRGAAPLGVSLQVHGAHAWGTAAPGALGVEPSVVHHEIGASLGAGYAIPFRLDVTYRLTDGAGVVVGFGVARLF